MAGRQHRNYGGQHPQEKLLPRPASLEIALLTKTLRLQLSEPEQHWLQKPWLHKALQIKSPTRIAVAKARFPFDAGSALETGRSGEAL
jgi:hypothetical protein